MNQRTSLKIFAISAAGAEYVDDVRIRDHRTVTRCGNPMFVGPTEHLKPESRQEVT